MAKPFTITGTQTGRGHTSNEVEVPIRKKGTARDIPSAEQQNVPWPDNEPLDPRASKTQKPFRVK